MCPVPLLSNGLLFVISVSCLIILLQDAAGEAVLEGINRLSSLYEELLLRGPLFILIWASKPHVLGARLSCWWQMETRMMREMILLTQQNGEEMFER